MHHRDPFDRILIAQAQIEGLTLVTRDAHIQKYDVSIMAVREHVFGRVSRTRTGPAERNNPIRNRPSSATTTPCGASGDSAPGADIQNGPRLALPRTGGRQPWR